MKNIFDDELLKINSIELNQSKLEKTGKENEKNINISLTKALKDIEFLKNKINENEKDIKLFKEKIQKLEEEKRKKSKEKEKEEKDLDIIKIDNEIKNNSKIYSSKTYKKRENESNYNTLSSRIKSIRSSRNIFVSTEPNNYYTYNQEDNLNKEKNEKEVKKKLGRNYSEVNFFKRPEKFFFYKTISFELFNKNLYNNRACIFEYNKKDIFIVFGVTSLDLMYYDCTLNIAFILFTNLHKDSFDSCRHFYDNENNRDLIITSSLDRHVKVILKYN